MKISFVAGVIAYVLLSTGCATITRGTTEAWTVESEPVGADVILSSGETCKTPCTLKKKRKHPFVVTIVKEGFHLVETHVLSQVAGAGAAGMAGNVLVGGLIGITVDATSGATKELKPNPLVVRLEPLESASATDAIETPPPAVEETTEAVAEAMPED